MRILVISQYFPPETGGPQNRLASLVDGFHEAGHEVHVITEKPNYPTGVIWDAYRGGAFHDGKYGETPVTYTWIWEDHKKRFLTRIRFYLSFVIMAILASFRVKGKFDAVLASSPPLFVGLAGWAISRLKGAKYVFDVRDLWPDVAIAMGELRSEKAARIAKRVEKFIYRKADGITAVTESFCEEIRKAAGRQKRVACFTNGTMPDVFRIRTSKTELRNHLNLQAGRFLVLFAGNLGLAQGLDHILDAACLLLESAPDVQFLFAGDGVRKTDLETRAEELQLVNVTFLPRVPLEEAARYMAASDALLVPLGRKDIYTKFIPSKLFDSMASGRPVLLSVDGESRKILERAQAGLYYTAEDARGLAEAVMTLRNNPAMAERMGRCASEFVETHFSRRTIALEMAGFLEEIVQGVKSADRLPHKPGTVVPKTKSKL